MRTIRRESLLRPLVRSGIADQFQEPSPIKGGGVRRRPLIASHGF